MARSLKKTASASRRRAYAKHRRSSVCATKKRGAACKRTDGCRWAKGKKRSYCRRSRNRKY